jgi:peptide/nickel transport system permease protein
MGLLNPTIKMAKRLVMRLLVVWLVFSLSILASRSLPGDPVRLYMSTESSKGTPAQFQERYLKVAARYHLDKPLFYFSVLPISSRNLRDFSLDLNYSPSQKRFLQEYEWPESHLFLEFAKKQSLADPENSFWKQQVENPKPENCPPDLTISLPQRIPVWQKLIPIILWNGFDNQYHLSIMSFFKGDWGVSIKSGEPVWTRIKRSVGWTLALNIPALLLAAGISVFLGVFLARKEGSGPARWLEALLPIGFAIPVFVLAIVCMQIFQWLGIPLGESSMGKGYSLGGTLANYIQTAAIPIVCMVIPAIGFLSRQVKLSFQAELARPYTTYLWLRGVSAMRVYWFYIFKNALITLSTDIGRLITSMVSGLLLVEIVFNIPGMGRLLYEAIWSRDWPVLNAVLLVSTVLAVVGLMIADLIVYGATRKKSNPI